jgi:glutaredoxin
MSGIIPLPQRRGFTIYGRTGCKYCHMAKQVAMGQTFNYHDIGSYRGFERRIRPLIGDYGTVPVVFSDKVFIGGYTELKAHVDSRNSRSGRSGGATACALF